MTQHYLNTASSGSGDGTTIATSGANAAWAAISEITGLAAGDTVSFNKGNTWREQLTVPASGSSGSIITFNAYGTGNDPIINGADVIETWTAVDEDEDYSINTDASAVATDRWFRTKSDGGRFANNGTQIRVQLIGHSTNGVLVTGCSVGERVGSTPDFSEAPTRITFDTGSSTVTLPTSSGTKWSDWVTYSWTGANNHLVHVNTGNDSGTIYYTYEATTYDGAYVNEDDGDKTMTQDVTESADTAHHYLVSSIEIRVINVWQATLTTEPLQVFFDGTRGTSVGSIVLCNGAGKWFWDSNVLYVYHTEDPDGDIVIEAAKRNYGITVIDHDYITTQNIKIEKTNSHGMYVTTSAGNVTNWTVTGMNIRNVAEGGIYFAASSHNCNGNEISSNTIYYWNGEGATDNRAIFFSGNGGSNNTISSNTIEGDIAYGVDTNEANNGIQVTAGASNVIQSNDITGCDHGIYMGTGTTAWDVSFNYIHQTGDDSIWIQGNDATGLCSYNLLIDSSDNGIDIDSGSADDAGKFYNNTYYDSGSGGNSMNLGTTSGRHAIVKNNIFARNGGTHFYLHHDATVNACTFDNNCWYGEGAVFAWHNDGAGDKVDDFAEWQSRFSADANGLNSDPLMADPANDDFTLQVGSPCINAGVGVSLATDYTGSVVAVPPDIGAYEKKTSSTGVGAGFNMFLGMGLK